MTQAALIGALIVVDPKKAKKQILQALKDTGMQKGLAAKQLGCVHATLIRWIQKLRLQPDITLMMSQARKEGWLINGRTGRPKGTTVANGAARRFTKTRRVRTAPKEEVRRIPTRRERLQQSVKSS